jgi:hypothetical protein
MYNSALVFKAENEWFVDAGKGRKPHINGGPEGKPPWHG